MQKHVDISNLDLEKLSNEFAMVRFGKVRMGNGERLLIQSSGGEQVLLDSTILEALASLGHEDLSRLLVAVSEL